MDDDVRDAFRRASGFDPLELFATRKDEASLRSFLDFRAELARRMQRDWLAQVLELRSARQDLDITLTHVDDRFDTGMKDAIGADAYISRVSGFERVVDGARLLASMARERHITTCHDQP